MSEIRSSVEPRLARAIHAKAAHCGFPAAANFELTPRCNFNCKMCYVHLTKEEQERRGRELTAAEWIDLGRQACEAGVVFLLITGGEPTLRPDFPEIYRALKKMGLMISVNSNGFLLRGELLELFKNDPPYRINLSLYGVSNETYAELCGIPAYERIVENIHALRQAGVDVKLNMSLTDANRKDMQAVYEKARELGVHTQAASYMFPPVRVTGQFGKGFRMSAQEAAQCEISYNRLRMDDEQFLRYAKNLAEGIPNETTDDCEGQVGSEMRCRAGRSSFWLSWDGKLSPCGMLPEPSVNVLETGLQAAWEQVRDRVREIRLPAKCSTCQYRHGCHVCAAMCYCESGAFDQTPEYVCELTRHSFLLAAAEAAKIGGNHEEKA